MRLVVPLTVVMPNHGPTQEDGIPRVSGSKPPSYPDDLLDSTDLSHLALACTKGVSGVVKYTSRDDMPRRR